MTKQDKLQRSINKIVKGINESFAILESELSHPAKNFSIMYDGKSVEFFYPTTLEEDRRMKYDRADFIRYLLKSSIDATLSAKVQDMDDPEAWDDLIGVISGEDPKDHQFEKYEVVIDESEAQGDAVNRAIPLNMDNYQVKENLGLLNEKIDQQN